MSKPIKVVSENIEWLEEEWNKAWDEKESGELKTVPEWWFDDARLLVDALDKGVKLTSSERVPQVAS